MIVLKLGGSVITHKGQPETVDEPALTRAADAIAEIRPDLVIVHGGGSFGHPAADKHGITPTQGTQNASALRSVHAAMHRLNAEVIDHLAHQDIPVLPVQPLSFSCRDGADALSMPIQCIETMLEEGFVPVTHGDVIAHAGKGGTVVSGDELVVALARNLGADRVGLCASVPGVVDADGTVIPFIEAYEQVEGVLTGSNDTDVTGGMAAKVQALLTLESSSWVFSLDDLDAFLSGKSPGTRIK